MIMSLGSNARIPCFTGVVLGLMIFIFVGYWNDQQTLFESSSEREDLSVVTDNGRDMLLPVQGI